nr:hypothetical protein [Methylobacterium sp. L1A1]
MPLYFFDIEDGEQTADEQGTMLERPGSVEAVALKTMLDIARFDRMRSNERGLAVSVRDETGTEVYRTELTVRAAWLVQAGSALC